MSEWRDPFFHQVRAGAPAGLRGRIEQLAAARGRERARAYDQAAALLQVWERRRAVVRFDAESAAAAAAPIPASAQRAGELRRTRDTLHAVFENAVGEAFNDHGCSLEDIALGADDVPRDEFVSIVFDDAAQMRERGG